MYYKVYTYKERVRDMILSIGKYVTSIFSYGKITFSAIIGGICYLMFPIESLKICALAVLIGTFLDLFSKWYAISMNNGGYANARRNKAILSRHSWRGTRTKLFTYISFGIMAGLFYRIIPIKEVSMYFIVSLYILIFLREFESIMENFDDAGADVWWISSWVRKKREKLSNDMNKNLDNLTNQTMDEAESKKQTKQ